MHPDLLIVDLHLNPGSGVAAVDIVNQTRLVPHILVSGNIIRLRQLRPDAVLLEKPFTLAALGAAIQRATETGLTDD